MNRYPPQHSLCYKPIGTFVGPNGTLAQLNSQTAELKEKWLDVRTCIVCSLTFQRAHVWYGTRHFYVIGLMTHQILNRAGRLLHIASDAN